jgi:hypothetical protein
MGDLRQKVVTLEKSFQNAGVHKLIWNGTDCSSQSSVAGVYFYQLKSGKNLQVNKLAVAQIILIFMRGKRAWQILIWRSEVN